MEPSHRLARFFGFRFIHCARTRVSLRIFMPHQSFRKQPRRCNRHASTVLRSDARAICRCGHVQSWHDREAARAMRSGELASDRRCYREIGGAGCRCGGFRDSGELAVVAVPTQAGRSVVTSLLLVVVLIVMGLALLYAYRSQTPSVQTIVYSQALQEISSGQVRKVTITGSKATLELQSGEKQQTTVPQPPEALEKVLNDYNSANPARPITIEFQSDSSGFQVVFSIILSLLPVLLLGAFFLYMTSRLRSR